MLYEMMHYANMVQFNEDAERRRRLVKDMSVPLSPRLWWKVEQVMPLGDNKFDVLWSRPEPLPTH